MHRQRSNQLLSLSLSLPLSTTVSQGFQSSSTEWKGGMDCGFLHLPHYAHPPIPAGCECAPVGWISKRAQNGHVRCTVHGRCQKWHPGGSRFSTFHLAHYAPAPPSTQAMQTKVKIVDPHRVFFSPNEPVPEHTATQVGTLCRGLGAVVPFANCCLIHGALRQKRVAFVGYVITGPVRTCAHLGSKR